MPLSFGEDGSQLTKEQNVDSQVVAEQCFDKCHEFFKMHLFIHLNWCAVLLGLYMVSQSKLSSHSTTSPLILISFTTV